MSAGTFKQHLASKKHNQRRGELKEMGQKVMSKSSSSSSFEVIGAEKPVHCIFCLGEGSQTHLRVEHNFPPFEDQCVDLEGLIAQVREKISNLTCIYC